MRKYAIGFIAGALLMTSITALADSPKEYVLTNLKFPVLLNGKGFNDKDLPFMNYNGNTYIPLKVTGDLLGVPVKWNDELRQVEIGSTPLKNDLGIEFLHDYIKDARDSAIKYEGEIYLTIVAGSSKYGLFALWNRENNELTFKYSQVKAKSSDDMSKGIDAFTYRGMTYVKESVFISAEKEVQVYLKNQQEQVEKQYPHFKSLFKMENKLLSSDNKIDVYVSHSGYNIQQLDEFFEYFNALGDINVQLMEMYALEVYEQNPGYPLSIYFFYEGVYDHFLGNVSVDSDGKVMYSSVQEINNTKPDVSKLN